MSDLYDDLDAWDDDDEGADEDESWCRAPGCAGEPLCCDDICHGLGHCMYEGTR